MTVRRLAGACGCRTRPHRVVKASVRRGLDGLCRPTAQRHWPAPPHVQQGSSASWRSKGAMPTRARGLSVNKRVPSSTMASPTRTGVQVRAQPTRLRGLVDRPAAGRRRGPIALAVVQPSRADAECEGQASRIARPVTGAHLQVDEQTGQHAGGLGERGLCEPAQFARPLHS